MDYATLAQCRWHTHDPSCGPCRACIRVKDRLFAEGQHQRAAGTLESWTSYSPYPDWCELHGYVTPCRMCVEQDDIREKLLEEVRLQNALEEASTEDEAEERVVDLTMEEDVDPAPPCTFNEIKRYAPNLLAAVYINRFDGAIKHAVYLKIRREGPYMGYKYDLTTQEGKVRHIGYMRYFALMCTIYGWMDGVHASLGMGDYQTTRYSKYWFRESMEVNLGPFVKVRGRQREKQQRDDDANIFGRVEDEMTDMSLEYTSMSRARVEAEDGYDADVEPQDSHSQQDAMST